MSLTLSDEDYQCVMNWIQQEKDNCKESDAYMRLRLIELDLKSGDMKQFIFDMVEIIK